MLSFFPRSNVGNADSVLVFDPVLAMFKPKLLIEGGSKNGPGASNFTSFDSVESPWNKLRKPLGRDLCGTKSPIFWGIHVPSGQHLHNELERSTMLFMGKLTSSMAMINSKLLVITRRIQKVCFLLTSTESHDSWLF